MVMNFSDSLLCLSLQKLLSESQKQSLTKEFNSLNLTKYIGEVVLSLLSSFCLNNWLTQILIACKCKQLF